MSLGSCEQCHGPLCVRGQTVGCERCGKPHPGHPRALELADAEARARAAAPRPDPVTSAGFVSTVPDRTARLEAEVKALAEEVAQFRDALRGFPGKQRKASA